MSADARSQRSTRGAVYIEFLIAFMPLLVFFLCLWQVSILYGTKLFVDHAAFSGARAAAVVIAESANRVGDSQGASSVGTLDGRRNRLVQDAVALAMLPLILDGTVISYNVQYPDGATPGGPNTMLGQKYAGMGQSTVTMARVRVRAMMNCKVAFANAIMCGGILSRIAGLVGSGPIFPPYVYVKSEAIFPYQGVNYTYDPNDDSGGSPSNAENSPLAAQNISGCFVAGTSVETIDGARPIEAIQAGDLVLTRDVDTGALSYGRVVGTSVVVDKPVVDVRLAETETIRATPNHLFWTADRGWVPAGELVAGEALSSARFGELHVVAVEPEAEHSTVFNFEVGETHTYYVGEAEALVHNAQQVCSNDGGTNGSTVDPDKGTFPPRDLAEQLAVQQAQSDPLGKNDPSTKTTQLPLVMSDPRWPAADGWVKMQQIIQTSSGTINVHYVYNTNTGATDDFKIKGGGKNAHQPSP
ncbi:MAG TPA: polymorphic toxin-type HINT domain-containing protein [Polyangiaceae bacterium]|jgi:hypothetical protein|nr:polymorphic toxin-type HINT domain-containing protein [Polyangiaceae bacterium]